MFYATTDPHEAGGKLTRWRQITYIYVAKF